MPFIVPGPEHYYTCGSKYKLSILEAVLMFLVHSMPFTVDMTVDQNVRYQY